MPNITLNELLSKINAALITPVVTLLFTLALAFFLYGVFNFIRGADDEEARKTGQRHMLWGVVGIAIMVSVYGIMKVICTTINC